jgi:hypothetical protein
VESASPNPLGSNIQHILGDIGQELDSDSSVGMECEKDEVELRSQALSLISKEEARPRVPMPVRSPAPTPTNAERVPMAEASCGDSHLGDASSSCITSLVRPSEVD